MCVVVYLHITYIYRTTSYQVVYYCIQNDKVDRRFFRNNCVQEMKMSIKAIVVLLQLVFASTTGKSNTTESVNYVETHCTSSRVILYSACEQYPLHVC